MAAHQDAGQFAQPDDVAVGYMQRLREYYLALGYDNPYRWAHFAEVPFCQRKPLSQSRVGLVTTAAPFKEVQGNRVSGL